MNIVISHYRCVNAVFIRVTFLSFHRSEEKLVERKYIGYTVPSSYTRALNATPYLSRLKYVTVPVATGSPGCNKTRRSLDVASVTMS
jgi:hypothetical protein